MFLILTVPFFVYTAFLCIPLWRICEKAGYHGALSLLVLIPGIGLIVLLCLLAFDTWPNQEPQLRSGNSLPAYPSNPQQNTPSGKPMLYQQPPSGQPPLSWP